LEIVQALEMSEAINVQNLVVHGSPFVNTIIGAERLYGENRILNVQELAEQRKAASRQWIILN
jgi:hypothetical protein